ncbi:2-isopropylmalate synthase [Marinobacter sp. F4216]|uniref:2-isopropylmalate synthase n=1 Tax=Marinobacter sp. F4216 TaxID=2874281 RepID=UPI001CC0468C|nr:2-isopropylmalate synthase [Marinobacter sp. F4216]MBZ2167139.1 2-isopropylmalate synthase [Marinobacter sp. F4216]
MIRSENERQFYLGMVGVSLWYAREPLPGAAPSPEFVFHESEPATDSRADEALADLPIPARPAQLTKPAAPADKGAAKARVSNLQALVGGKESGAESAQPVQKSASPVKAPEPEVSAPKKQPLVEDVEAVSAAAPLKLALKLWKGKRFVLISDLSSGASLKLQEALAENILKSIGEHSVESSGPISWPLFNNLRAPGNALSDLQSVLEHALSQIEGQKVIVLGALLPEAEGDWLQRLAGCKSDVQFPLTLAELASDPNQKRALWEQLKPFAS